jgi:hypothetical protein
LRFPTERFNSRRRITTLNIFNEVITTISATDLSFFNIKKEFDTTPHTLLVRRV